MLASVHQRRLGKRGPIKLNIFRTQVSQRFSQVSITLDKLVKVVNKAEELLNFTQAGKSWPVDHRLHLFGVRFDTITANDVTQIRKLSLSPNTIRRFEQQFMLAQLRQYNLNMLLVLISGLAEDENVINEHNGKLSQLMPRVQATTSIELRRVEQLVHNCLECSWCISQIKGKHSELVMTKWGPKCSFRLVLILQKDLVKPKCCIKARTVLCFKQLVKYVVEDSDS